MNLAQVLAPNGRVEYERLVVEAPGSAEAEVVVREWHATKQRHQHVYTGPMSVDHIKTLAAERSCLPNE